MSPFTLQARDYETIKERRREGATLQEIANDFGVSREWIRVITANVTPLYVCHCCGDVTPRKNVCEKCRHCSVCGKELQWRQWAKDYVCFSCRPKKGARGPLSLKRVEQGIYRRFYIETGYESPGFYTNIGTDGRWVRHESLEAARKHRGRALVEGRLAPREWKSLS